VTGLPSTSQLLVAAFHFLSPTGTSLTGARSIVLDGADRTLQRVEDRVHLLVVLGSVDVELTLVVATRHGVDGTARGRSYYDIKAQGLADAAECVQSTSDTRAA
jgi:hypothetical protein